MLDPNSLLMTNLTWFPWPSRPWLFFALSSLSGITGDVGKSLAVALCMIDLFAKWLESEVATLAGGYRSLWGRHQLLTATDKLSLPLGIHMSTVVGNGAEFWPKMLGAVMTLKHHESVCADLPPDLLFFFDMMEVEKVPALAGKWNWILYMTGEKLVPEPPMITNSKVNPVSLSVLIHCLTAAKIMLSFHITLWAALSIQPF